MRAIIKVGYVYILTNKQGTVLYVGVTSELQTRIFQHKTNYYPNSFSARYKLKKLVYFECFETIEEAVQVEKQLKAGSRQKKLDLINKINPLWKDLSDEIQDFD